MRKLSFENFKPVVSLFVPNMHQGLQEYEQLSDLVKFSNGCASMGSGDHLSNFHHLQSGFENSLTHRGTLLS